VSVLQRGSYQAGAVNGSVHWFSTYHIAGGSGRFAGASGQGSFDGRGDFTNPNDLTFTYTFNGTMSAANED